MRPGRQIRMGVQHATLGQRVLWRGYIDAVTPVYDPVQPDTVEFACIDALGEVNRAKTKPLPDPVFAGDTATTRVHRLLDAAAWLPVKRDVATTTDTLLASNMGGQTADLLGQVADSVGGAVFGDQRGNICFRPRDWQAFDPTIPIDGVIGNGGATDVCPVRWTRPFDRASITTRVIIGRDVETALQLDDLDGQARYGIEPFERVNLLTQSDARLTLLAERVLETRDDSTAPKVRSVTLEAATSDASLDLQAAVDPFKPSRYQCRLELDRGEVFEEQHFATGLRHTIDPHSSETLINLDLAGPYETTGTARWDDAWFDGSTWAELAGRTLGRRHTRRWA